MTITEKEMGEPRADARLKKGPSSKLTKARRDMLEQLRNEPGYYADYYPPLKWALEMGYAAARECGNHFRITRSGLALLQGHAVPGSSNINGEK